MSQTETILLIVLGFSLASLIALFMGRMVWTMALKRGARRMQRQLPSTLVGLQTERNRLRAENAMLAQRLGSRLEAAKLHAAEQMAEVSRHRNRLHQVKDQVKALETALAAAAAREQDLRNQLAGAGPNQANQHRRKAETTAKTSAARKPAAAHQAAPPATDDEILLRQRIEKLAEIARQGQAERQSSEPPRQAPEPEDAVLAEKLSEAERRTAELEEQLHKLDAEWDGESVTKSGPAPAPDEDNVIALSARIHNLRKSLGKSE